MAFSTPMADDHHHCDELFAAAEQAKSRLLLEQVRGQVEVSAQPVPAAHLTASPLALGR